jgi:hypothetical protein
MLEDDYPLQEVVKKKMARQELELREMVEEMAREDRKERVLEIKRMVSLEEMMMSLEITMSRESLDSHKNQEQHEVMDWSEVELGEHAMLENLQVSLGIGVLDEEDWKMIDMDSEHGYLDDIIMELEHGEVNRELVWRRQPDKDGDDLDYDWLVMDCDDQEEPPEIASGVRNDATETAIEHLSQLTREEIRLALSDQRQPTEQQLLMPLDSLVFSVNNLYEEFGFPASVNVKWKIFHKSDLARIDLIKNYFVGI